MGAQEESAAGGLASFLRIWRWGLWRDKRWQYTSLWSLSIWILNTGLLYLVINRWGHGLLILILQNIFWDGVTFVANRKWKMFWGDRQVSTLSSGGWTLVITVFCFLYHKAATLMLVTLFGVGVFDAKMLQGIIGIIENPVRYKLNNKLVFAEPATKARTA